MPALVVARNGSSPQAYSGQPNCQSGPVAPTIPTPARTQGYITAESAKEMGLKPLKLSGTEFRKRLRAGEDIPEWFAFKSVVDVLRSN